MSLKHTFSGFLKLSAKKLGETVSENQDQIGKEEQDPFSEINDGRLLRVEFKLEDSGIGIKPEEL